VLIVKRDQLLPVSLVNTGCRSASDRLEHGGRCIGGRHRPREGVDPQIHVWARIQPAIAELRDLDIDLGRRLDACDFDNLSIPIASARSSTCLVDPPST